VAFNENLNHFLLRPGQLPSIARHIVWRAKNVARWLRRTPFDRRLWWARTTAWFRPRWNRAPAAVPVSRPDGVSVVIPSRTGKNLLPTHPPPILPAPPDEIIIVDNGSTDPTAAWLAATYPQIRVEVSAAPLSFARAVNRGIAIARYSHVCLLNND